MPLTFTLRQLWPGRWRAELLSGSVRLETYEGPEDLCTEATASWLDCGALGLVKRGPFVVVIFPRLNKESPHA